MSARGALSALIFVALLGVLAWFAEGTPPELQAELPASPAAGPLTFSARASDARTGIAALELRVAGGLHVMTRQGDRWSIELPPPPDGEHEVVVCARDRSLQANETCEAATLTVDNTPPVLTLAGGEGLAQGGATGVVLAADEDLASVEATFDDRPVVLDARGGHYRGFVGAGVKLEPGEHELVVAATDRAGLTRRVAFALPVAETAFPDGGYVELPPDRAANMKNDTKRAFDREQRAAAYARAQDEWLIGAPFLAPTEGRVSSPFGKVRTYNTGVVRHHLGTDIAAPKGRPVRASADGVVALAEELPIHGGAVILRHAPDVSSSYNHLSVISVEVGDRVSAGDVVGEVGSTGQSTGPHLHWGFVVGGVAVAPEQWAEPFTWPGRVHERAGTAGALTFREPTREIGEDETTPAPSGEPG
jgi:murein DD-endopeptidase MepM/ murein hydrolase activator NlpD